MADDQSQSPPVDVRALLEVLDSQLDELARNAGERFVIEVPAARQWSADQRDTFVRQARGRLSAILAVTGQGLGADDTLRRDLEEVGANAAWSGTSLPHVLLALRISRDLLLGEAMKTASAGAGWHEALTVFTRRLLPATDSLTDALVTGFWGARLSEQQEHWHRLASVVEGSSYGVYEADIDGALQYANAKLGAIVGMPPGELQGASLGDVFRPTGGTGSVAALLAEPPGDAAEVAFTIEGTGGEPVELDINTVVRRIDGNVVGFGGIVRRLSITESVVGPTADSDAMVRHVTELQGSLEILAEAGGFLQRHAEELDGAQVAQAGDSVRRQAERLVEVVNELEAERTGQSPT